MDAVVKEEKNMIEPKKEVEETVELKEPKVEMVDEMDVKKEEIDEDDYQHMIPHEYRDYLEKDVEAEKPAKRKRQAEQESPFKKKTAECQVCQKTIITDCFSLAENHAATHTNLKRYSCPVEECVYECYLSSTAIYHMKSTHKMIKSSVKNFLRRELSDKEKELLRETLKICFPGVSKPTTKTISQRDKALSGSIFSCQVCNFISNELRSTVGRRNHAMMHTDIMFYKCSVQDCNFTAKQCWSVRAHQNTSHLIEEETTSRLKIELTIEQELQVERIVIRCFPDLKDDSEHRMEMIKLKMNIDVEDRALKSPINKKHSCNVCHELLPANALASSALRRHHAVSHTDVMLYKCSKQTCNFESTTYFSITRHQKWMHNVTDMPVGKIELTNEQEMEIRRMVLQCFPEWNDE